jgi:predicted porin
MNLKMTLAGILTAVGSSAVHAQSQSNVTVYGVLDEYLGYTRAEGKPSNKSVDSGGFMASRLGFRGSEDLGGGLKANFLLEHGLAVDTGAQSDSTRFFNRAAWIGLSSSLGELRAGRQNTPQFFMLGSFDAFGGATYGSLLNNVTGYVPRFDNTIHYISPEWSGFKFQAGLSLGEKAGSSSDLNTYLFGAEYKSGRFYLGANHARQKSFDGSFTIDASFLGGNFDYGSGKIYVGFFSGDTPGSNAGNATTAPVKGRSTRAWSLSADYRFTPELSLGALVGASNDTTAANGDANQVSFIGKYSLSARTLIYGVGTRLSNKNAANFSLGAAGPITRNTPVAGGDADGLQVGVRHLF